MDPLDLFRPRTTTPRTGTGPLPPARLNARTLDLSSLQTRSHVPPAGSAGNLGTAQQHTAYARFHLQPVRFRIPGTDVVRELRGGQILALQTVRTGAGADGGPQLVQRALYELVEELNQNPHDTLGNFQRLQRLTQLLTRQEQIGMRNAGGVRRGQLLSDALDAAGLRPPTPVRVGNLPMTTALSMPLPQDVYVGRAQLGKGLMPGDMRSYAAIVHDPQFGQRIVQNPLVAALYAWDSDGDRAKNFVAGHLAQMPVYPTHRTDAGRLMTKLNEQRELRLLQGTRVSLAGLQTTTRTPGTVLRAVEESVRASRSALSPQTAADLRAMAQNVVRKQGEDVGRAHLSLHATSVIDALRQLHALPTDARAAIETDPEAMAMYLATHRTAFNTPGEQSMARMLEQTIKATQRGKRLGVDEYEALGRMLGLNKLAQRPKGITRQNWEQTADYLQEHGARAVHDALTRARLGLFDPQELTERPAFSSQPRPVRAHNLTLPARETGAKTQLEHLLDLGLVRVRAVSDGRGQGAPAHMIQFLDVDTGELRDAVGGAWTDEQGRVTRTDLVMESSYALTDQGYKLLTGTELLEAHLEMNQPRALEVFDPVLKKRVLVGDVHGTVWDPARVLAGDSLATSQLQALGSWSGRSAEALRTLAQHDPGSYAQMVARYQISTTHSARRFLEKMPETVQDLRGTPQRFVYDPHTGSMHIPAHTRTSLSNHLQFFTGLEQGASEDEVLAAFEAVARDIKKTRGQSVAWAEPHPASSRDYGARLLLGHGHNQVPSYMDPGSRVNNKRAGGSMKLSQTGEMNNTNILYVQLDAERYAQHLRVDARSKGVRLSVADAQNLMRDLVGDTKQSVLGAEFHLEDSVYASRSYLERVLARDAQAGGLRPEEMATTGARKFISPFGELKSQATFMGHSMEFELENGGGLIPVDMLRPIENALRRGEIDQVVEGIARHPALAEYFKPALSAYRAVRDAETSTPQDWLEATDKFLASGLRGTFRVRDEQGRVVHEFPALGLMQETPLAHVRNTTELGSQMMEELTEANDQVVLDPMDASNMLASISHMINAQGADGQQATIQALKKQTAVIPGSDMGQLLTSNAALNEELRTQLGMVGGLAGQETQADAGAAAVGNIFEQGAARAVGNKLGFAAGHVAGDVLGTKGGLGKIIEQHALQVLEQFFTH